MEQSVKGLYEKYADMAKKTVVIKGWIRNHRAQKNNGFINLHDGSFFESVQIVYDEDKLANFEDVQKIKIGASIIVSGEIVVTPSLPQPFEIHAHTIECVGDSKEDYPIQPKRHSREFLRENAHLRLRTNLFTAVFRVRNILNHALHTFFQNRDFIYVTAPLITGSDAEGAGEMFKVTTFDLLNVPKDKENRIDFKEDFFGKPANLTVSGQLQAEIFAQAFKKVYTFGPTFRAEKSNTTTHASEFWMIEPEIAFADINDNMDLAEEMVKEIIREVLEKAPLEMAFFDKYVQKGLLDKLHSVASAPFVRITHKEAIDVLLAASISFEHKPEYTSDLATEHEKYLVTYYKKPVFVIDWPKEIKAFYMRLNDDGKTVAAMDLLVPGAGELIGGSQREERLEHLEKRMKEMHIDKEELWWYLDLRKYGTTPHAGYGLGFDRMLMYITGVENIRDIIPFPRTPRNCQF